MASESKTQYGDFAGFKYSVGDGTSSGSQTYFEYPESGFIVEMNMTTTKEQRKTLINELKTRKWLDSQTRGVIFALAMDNPQSEEMIILRYIIQIPGNGVMIARPETNVFYYGIFKPIIEKAFGAIIFIVCVITLILKVLLLIYRKPNEEEEEENLPSNTKKKIEVQCDCPSILRIFNVFRIPSVSEVYGIL